MSEGNYNGRELGIIFTLSAGEAYRLAEALDVWTKSTPKDSDTTFNRAQVKGLQQRLEGCLDMLLAYEAETEVAN